MYRMAILPWEYGSVLVQIRKYCTILSDCFSSCVYSFRINVSSTIVRSQILEGKHKQNIWTVQIWLLPIMFRIEYGFNASKQCTHLCESEYPQPPPTAIITKPNTNNNNSIVQRHVQAKRRITTDGVFFCVCVYESNT